MNPYKTYELGQLVSSGYQIFDDTWDTYIKEHKQELCEKIIRRYYFNEICCDEPDRFRHYINEHLQRIMPYYNQLYKSELVKFDPMINHALETNGRSVENLIRSANTSDSEVSKILSNFAKSNKGISNTGTIEVINRTENEVYNRTYTEDVGTTETENTNTDRNRTDEIKRTGETHTTLEETQTTSGDKTRLYSDTPQRAVTGDIDETYLTNYTHDTDDTTVTTNNTTDTTMTETTNETENETTNTERTLDRDVHTAGSINDNREKTTNQNRNLNTTTNNSGFEQSSDDRNESRGKQTAENEESTNDKGEYTLVKGFMNMTPSYLLQAFRETFLNIDEQIINDLSTNFMEVF